VNATRSARNTRWPLIGVLGLALVLRLIEARGVKLWFDEIYIVMVGRMHFGDILRVAASDIHPPLHFLVRRVWQLAGGESDRWLKLFSIGCSLVAIAFTEALGRRAISPRAGLLAAVLCAICPAHVHVSQMVDVYPMFWALASFTAWAGWRFVTEHQQRHLLALAVGAVLALYTQYLAIPFLAAIAVWGAVLVGRDPATRRRWIGMWVIVAILFVPQARILVAQFHMEGNGSFFTFPSPRGLFDLSRAIAFGSYLAVPLFAVAILAGRTLTRHRRAIGLLVLLIAFTVPSTRLWALVLTRDMLVVMPFVFLLVALGLERLPGQVAPALASLVLIAIGAREYATHERFTEPLRLDLVEQIVDQAAHPNDLVLHAETHSLLFFLYYEPGRHNRLLADPGYHVPYFDAGLVIPDSCLITPAEWARQRAAGVDWWGIRVDRAYTTRGHSTRAGARDAAEFDSVAHDRHWNFPPVRVWHDVAATR
jgi:mannosyltransferase